MLVSISMPQSKRVEVRAHVFFFFFFQSDWQISINDMRFIIRSLQAASYHRILHVHPRKKGAEEHYQKIPFVPIFDRIQNVGTLGIHAKHTQHRPPGLSRAGLFRSWLLFSSGRPLSCNWFMQSCRTCCHQVSAKCVKCVDFGFHTACLTLSWCQHWCLQPCHSGRII